MNIMERGFPGATFFGHQSRGLRPLSSSRSRELFPLPLPPKVRAEKKLGRGAAQRIARSVQISEKVREAVIGLNWLAGFETEQNSNQFSPEPIQEGVLDRAFYLSRLAQTTGSLESVEKPEAALRALLQGRSEYDNSFRPTTLAACSLERISLPSSLVDAPTAESLLDGDALRYLQCPEQMLRDREDPECQTFQPYWDPLLKHDEKLYKRFNRKLDQAGFLVYTQRPKSMVGVFFVKKSDGVKIRMIIDARGTNMKFESPPGVELLTSDGFSRVEVSMPDGLHPGTPEYEQRLREHKIHIGLSDVKDCFHRLRQPRWLAEYFCFDPVPASWVGLEGKELDGVRLSAGSLVYPAPGSLCMGFTWSLFFAQRISEKLMSEVIPLHNSTLASDRGESMYFDLSKKDSVRHYVYVDNLGILSTDADLVEEGMQEVKKVFEEKNLKLHPGEVHAGSVKALGCDLRGDLMASRVTPERYHRLRQAIQGVLNRRKVSGRVLEVVIGHATFAGLTNRYLLSIFNTVYRFIRSNYEKPAVLWHTVREELSVFRGLMIYLHADWTRPWNNYVSASDASLSGFGIVSSIWSREDVAEVGRCQERGRFKKLGSHSARNVALTNAGFVRDEVTREWRAGMLDADEFLEISGWKLNPGFKDVPGHLLHRDEWAPRLWGKWKFKSGILELEARALVKSLKRIAMSVFGHDIRQLLLTDNMSVCLSFDRCRAKNFALLKQVRIFGAYCLARNLTCTIRWIPSELNSADEPSRLEGDEPSKTLTHVVPKLKGSSKGSNPQTTFASAPVGGSKVKDTSEAQGGYSGKFFKDSPVEKREISRRPGDTQAERELLSFERLRHPVDHASCEAEVQSFGLNELNRAECPQKEKAKSFGKEDEEPCKTGSRPRHGERGIPHVFGGPSSEGGNLQTVSSRAGTVQGLFKGQRCGDKPEPFQAGGQLDGGLHESDVFAGSSKLQGGQDDSSLLSPSPRVWQEWRSLYPPNVAMHQGLQKAHPGKESGGLPASGMGCLCCGDAEGWKTEDVHFRPPVRINLCEALGAFESQSLFFDPASAFNQQDLEPSAFAGGEPRAVQDWRFRHFVEPQQPLPSSLDRTFPGLSQVCSSRRLPLGFRLRGVPEDIQDGQRNVQTRHSGPSIDRARKYRSQLEVQKRGHWKAQKSVMRYEKSARFSLTWERLPPGLKDYALSCEADLGKILLGQKAAPKYGGEKIR